MIHTLIGKTHFGVYGCPKNKTVLVLLRSKVDNILLSLGWVMTVSLDQGQNILISLDHNPFIKIHKARTSLFLGCPYTPKHVLLINVWITPYKSSISLVLCQCRIRLGCYIHPLRDSASLLRFAHYRPRGHAEPLWYHLSWPNSDLARYCPLWALTRSARICLWGHPL